MVKADGLFYMEMFILHQLMGKAYGLFPVVIVTSLFHVVILYGLFEWL